MPKTITMLLMSVVYIISLMIHAHWSAELNLVFESLQYCTQLAVLSEVSENAWSESLALT